MNNLGSYLNESSETDKLAKNYIAMDIYNPGNEEGDIIDYIENGGKEKELFKSLDKVTKNMDPNEAGEYYAALEILFSEQINEQGKFAVYYTTPLFPDLEDAEGFVVFAKDEKDALDKVKKEKNLKKMYRTQVKELDKSSEYFKFKDLERIQ